MKQIYNIMVGMALMLGATSCEKEILDNGQAAGIALADGQFIVDYSGEVTTRAIKDNAEKGERINSLTYLLYMQQDNDYVLQKRREIPGLNETGTDANGNPTYESWPLTRDNMTWEQREALKDTLIVHCGMARIARWLEQTCQRTEAQPHPIPQPTSNSRKTSPSTTGICSIWRKKKSTAPGKTGIPPMTAR